MNSGAQHFDIKVYRKGPHVIYARSSGKNEHGIMQTFDYVVDTPKSFATYFANRSGIPTRTVLFSSIDAMRAFIETTYNITF